MGELIPNGVYLSDIYMQIKQKSKDIVFELSNGDCVALSRDYGPYTVQKLQKGLRQVAEDIEKYKDKKDEVLFPEIEEYYYPPEPDPYHTCYIKVLDIVVEWGWSFTDIIFIFSNGKRARLRIMHGNCSVSGLHKGLLDIATALENPKAKNLVK